MKNQIPDVKVSASKRVSPEVNELLHMLKSLEGANKSAETVSFAG